ncbi:GTPase [Bacillus sp. J14TS2]|uniref:dynamin family protein n=1 Tax=Bacillus sp. J14TS2 TaxID=2807188 RepID=UPI001B213F90|nr:dynamin family protein [Bacillus sp. J14TS2]GIN70110.1 GTPase [Bacillus sp. J14TS2]
MDNVLLTSSRERQLEQALTLLERFKQHEDQERVEKTLKLIEKIYRQETVIAFSGHFSAGKSTMINQLTGENILPSSPIPTSANIVKVYRSEKDFAKVYSHGAPPLLFTAPYEFTAVQNYCKKENITEIEIGRKGLELPDGLTIMDTPGIDSTDEAHRLSTESALHIADAVFYVMDYNHVQSELNFMYTKNLLRHGVRLYLIINQIDKHQSEELSFQAYKQSVLDAFAFWNVRPAGVFFTTLKQMKHPENEFTSIKMMIQDIFSHQDEWSLAAFTSSFNKLVEEHEEWLDESFQNEAVSLNQEISLFAQDHQDVFQTEDRLKNEKRQIVAGLEKLGDEYTTECEKILHNAYLMPFETRELAEQFLQAKQTDFKVGLLFSKKKTEDERNRRRQEFTEALTKQVDSQIVWHLRQLANAVLDKEKANNREWQENAQSLQVNWSEKLLDETVKKGAGVNGQYVLQYCEEIAEKIKRLAKKEWEQFLEPVITHGQEKMTNTLEKLDEQLIAISKASRAKRQLDQLEDLYTKMKQEITVLTGTEENTLQKLREQWKKAAENFTIYQEDEHEESVKKDSGTNVPTHTDETQVSILESSQVIQQLERMVQLLQEDHYFKRIRSQLQDKVKTLTERNYTIALFGAFSAGKSSFANALLGKAVLPVSPNPTTAAINRICPPTAEYTHGTAVVSLKSEQDMLADVNKSLSYFDQSCLSLTDAYQRVLNLTIASNQNEKEKVHLSFLMAFQNGFLDHQQQLGQTFKTDMENFREYVGNEAQSCFVESIDLYYDCSFTRQGITLVDTPGADSINARHTGVAFDYIKNADAVLFVTYYNHAFSKADREFLIQLGRVKDSFELDKMFFIVNAIDLASSQTEMEEVLDYVKGELIQNGIRFPKIFGLSSKLALHDLDREKSQIDLFQTAFDHFLQHDLQKMAVQSAKIEYNRALQFLDQLIKTANEDQELKNERRKEWQQAKTEMLDILSNDHVKVLSQQAEQEVEELTFYVKQRVFYRFPQFFKEAFNPAILKKNDRSLLQKCLQELLDTVGYDFSQEMRVTSLRVEKYTQKLLANFYSNLQRELQAIKADITFSQMEWNAIPTPEFAAAFADSERKPFEAQFKYFRNPKAFFEQDERKKMEEAFLEILSPLADDYLQQEYKRITEVYLHYLFQEYGSLINHAEQEVMDQFDSWFEALEGQENVAEWMKVKETLPLM